MVRTTVKSVFNFDSVGLMQILADMNEEQFAQAPVSYGGAINQGRRNLEVEYRQSEEENGGRSHIFPDAAHIHEGERGQSAPESKRRPEPGYSVASCRL